MGGLPFRRRVGLAEKYLCTFYRQGKPFAPFEPDSESWSAIIGDAKPVIRARVIHDLLLSDMPVVSGQLRQLNIIDTAVRGPLDLKFARIDYPVRFTRCTFDSQVTLSEAQMRSVSLERCTVPGIDASHVAVTGDLNLEDVEVSGPLGLAGAHLTDDLHLDGATITAEGTEAALDLTNIQVQGDIKANNLTVHGKVKTMGASIDGVLRMKDAEIHAGDGSVAWDGDGMKIGGMLEATGLRTTGQVRLVDARILVLDLRGAQVENSHDALVLDRLESQGSVFCDRESRITGGIHAIGIQVGATLYLNDLDETTVAQIPRVPGATGGDEGAVNLSRARITGDLSCAMSFQSIDLTGAAIGGRVSLHEACIRPDDANAGLAFRADRSEIGSDLECIGDFQGTMSLRRTRVGGGMIVDQRGKEPRSHFRLAAPGLRVAHNVDLRTTGKVDLTDADIAGRITVDLARLDDPENGAAADLSALRAGSLTLLGTPRSGFLDLTGASVGLLLDDPDGRPAESQIVLDGSVYGDIATARDGLRYRLAWLKAGTASRKTAANGYEKVRFTPQPYTQLADTWRRSGRDRDARQILCHMYREHNRTLPWRRWYSKVWNWIQDCFLGYGYVPSRALLWLVVLGGLASAWFTNTDILPTRTHIGIIEAMVLSLGLVLPTSRYNDIEKWQQMSPVSHLIAAGLVSCGLLLGATVLAALARMTAGRRLGD